MGRNILLGMGLAYGLMLMLNSSNKTQIYGYLNKEHDLDIKIKLISKSIWDCFTQRWKSDDRKKICKISYV